LKENLVSLVCIEEINAAEDKEYEEDIEFEEFLDVFVRI